MSMKNELSEQAHGSNCIISFLLHLSFSHSCEPKLSIVKFSNVPVSTFLLLIQSNYDGKYLYSIIQFILFHYGSTDIMVYYIPMMLFWWPSNWFVNAVLVSQRLKHGALFLHGISLITSLLFPLKSERLEICLLILFL